MASYLRHFFGLFLVVVTLLATIISPGWCTTTVEKYDFSRGLQGWIPNEMVTSAKISTDGLLMRLKTPDPFLVGPVLNLPAGEFVTVTLRMRSMGEPLAQLYFGSVFSETNCRNFVVNNDGLWHDYSVRLPPMGPGCRLRFDPPCGDGEVGLAWIRLETSSLPFQDLWATSAELRNKKFICGGQFGTNGGNTAVTSRYLAKHPEFTALFPYDGYIVPALLDAAWGQKMGLKPKIGDQPHDYFLHELIWNRTKIPDGAIDDIIKDLKLINWRGVTDNFLNFTLIDGARGRFTPDLTNDQDWAILEHNARMAARLCRESNLKGFWLDTEQYGNYRWRTESGVPEFDPKRPTELKFPLGKDKPEVLRRRGAQWIKAVQAELPAVKIIITFAWSPDANEYGPIKGVNGFLNGVLDGIEAPGQLIHGYENTFYFGQGPGTTHTREGFPGDRSRFDTARAQMRQWRAFSTNPPKYDKFLKVGMAAWVEDDPWNRWDNSWPSGDKSSFWSNLPLALASSDEYVWVWSEHTKYGWNTQGPINPFLASLRNRTFNTGTEQVNFFAEDFAKDPLQNGWFFDFDMLAIAGKKKEGQSVPIMTLDGVPYVWEKTPGALSVRGETATSQRRRFARPVEPVHRDAGFYASIDFQVEQFGTDPENPIVMGFFTSDHPVHQSSLTLRIASQNRVNLVLNEAGKSFDFSLVVSGGLQAGKTYRLSLDQKKGVGVCQAAFTDTSWPDKPLAQVKIPISEAKKSSGWDELGIAMWESTSGAAKPVGVPVPYRYQVKKVVLKP